MMNSTNPSHTANFKPFKHSLAPRLELVDSEGISNMLGLSRAHVTGRLTKRPDFPQPIVNLSQRIRRWLRSDVESWVMGANKKM
jgi:predicted DNA-binding transcriptional regulator AlpA